MSSNRQQPNGDQGDHLPYRPPSSDDAPLLRSRHSSPTQPIGNGQNGGPTVVTATTGGAGSQLNNAGGGTGGPDPTNKPFKVIPPPQIRPQHVYAPVAPMGMLTLGLLSKKKKEPGSQSDFRNILHGMDKRPFSFFFQDESPFS